MFRHIFIPTEENNAIPLVNVPKEWYNHEVEVIVFPIKQTNNESKENRLYNLYSQLFFEKLCATHFLKNIFIFY